MLKFLVTTQIPISRTRSSDMAITTGEAELALSGLLSLLRHSGCEVIGAGLDHVGAYFTGELPRPNADDPEIWRFPAYILLARREDPLQLIWSVLQQYPQTRLEVLQTNVIPMH